MGIGGIMLSFALLVASGAQKTAKIEWNNHWDAKNRIPWYKIFKHSHVFAVQSKVRSY